MLPLEVLLITTIIILPLLSVAYTVFLFWYANKQIKELDDIKMTILQIASNKAGLEDVIEEIDHSLDHISRQLQVIERLGRQVDGLAMSVRTLAGKLAGD